MVEPLPHHTNVQGLNPATDPAGRKREREKMVQIVVIWKSQTEHKTDRMINARSFMNTFQAWNKFSFVFVQLSFNWAKVYDNEITSLIDIYFLRISFIPSDPFRYFIYVTYSTDK